MPISWSPPPPRKKSSRSVSGGSGALLHCSVDSFRFLGFLLCCVLGPGGFREAPGGPGKAHGWPWRASRVPPDPLGPGSKNLKTYTFCWARLGGPARGENSVRRISHITSPVCSTVTGGRAAGLSLCWVPDGSLAGFFGVPFFGLTPTPGRGWGC